MQGNDKKKKKKHVTSGCPGAEFGGVHAMQSLLTAFEQRTVRFMFHSLLFMPLLHAVKLRHQHSKNTSMTYLLIYILGVFVCPLLDALLSS